MPPHALARFVTATAIFLLHAAGHHRYILCEGLGNAFDLGLATTTDFVLCWLPGFYFALV